MFRAWITLKEKSEIKELFRKGKRKSQKSLSIFFFRNSEKFPRILFCSDRTSKLSVQRNKVKRVLRALSHDKDVVFPNSYDIALIGSQEYLKLKYPERKEILMHLLKNVYTQ